VGKKRNNKRVLIIMVIGITLLISLSARAFVNPITISKDGHTYYKDNLTKKHDLFTDIKVRSNQHSKVSSTFALIIISYVYNFIIKENT
jgi:hypothetical protein